MGEAGGTLDPRGRAGKWCPDSWPRKEGLLPPGSIQAPLQGASPVNPFLARLQNYSGRASATWSKLFLISYGIYRESSAGKREAGDRWEGNIRVTCGSPVLLVLPSGKGSRDTQTDRFLEMVPCSFDSLTTPPHHHHSVHLPLPAWPSSSLILPSLAECTPAASALSLPPHHCPCQISLLMQLSSSTFPAGNCSNRDTCRLGLFSTGRLCRLSLTDRI